MKKTYWKALNAAEKKRIAAKVGRSVEYLRQIFVYDRSAGPGLARDLVSATDGEVSAHELCPDAYREGDVLDMDSDTASGAA